MTARRALVQATPVTVDIDKTAAAARPHLAGRTGSHQGHPGPALRAVTYPAVVAIALLAAVVYAFSQGKINWGAIPTTSSTTVS